MLYMIRVRDIMTGSEWWYDTTAGEHFSTDSRQTADCAALAVARCGTLELPYVVQVDPEVEDII